VTALTFDFTPRARVEDPVTSHEAAASVRNVTATHDRILEVLRDLRLASDEEIAARYRSLALERGWSAASPSGLRSRRAELVERGLVADSGRSGRTSSGRRTTLWIPANRPQ
jgi:hypothetical protein